MDDPFTPMHSSMMGGEGAYPNCLYGDGIGVCGGGGGGGGNYEKSDVGGRMRSTQCDGSVTGRRGVKISGFFWCDVICGWPLMSGTSNKEPLFRVLAELK